MGSRYQKAGEVIQFAVGGGWGKEKQEGDSNCKVAIIRGADFPDIENGVFENLPVRWEKEGKATKAALRAGDIVLEISGGTDERPTGRTVFVSQGLLDSFDCPVIPASFCRLVRSSSFIDPQYFYYWLQDMFNKGRTWGYQNRSTGLSNFQFKVFAEMEEVRIPPTIEQQQIAHILFMLDEKRRINTRLNDYLVEMLLAKYDHLFGSYDPSACNGTLSDVGEVVGGATPSKKKEEYYCHNGIGWITPRDLSNTTDVFIAHGTDDITEAGYTSCSAKIMPKGSVLFSSRAPIGYLAITSDEVATNQGFKSVVPKPEIGTAFVYCFLQRNKQRIADMGAGTTFPEVSGKIMKSVELAIPNVEDCAELSAFAEPILAMVQGNERENRELTQLKDALLPKLMSGEIDVSKVDIKQLNNHLVAMLVGCLWLSHITE